MIPPVVYDHAQGIAITAICTLYALGMAAVAYVARRAHVLAHARTAPARAARAAGRFRRGVAYHRAHAHRHARPAPPRRHLIHHARKAAA